MHLGSHPTNKSGSLVWRQDVHSERHATRENGLLALGKGDEERDIGRVDRRLDRWEEAAMAVTVARAINVAPRGRGYCGERKLGACDNAVRCERCGRGRKLQWQRRTGEESTIRWLVQGGGYRVREWGSLLVDGEGTRKGFE